jgi:hypothetical protein
MSKQPNGPTASAAASFAVAGQKRKRDEREAPSSVKREDGQEEDLDAMDDFEDDYDDVEPGAAGDTAVIYDEDGAPRRGRRGRRKRPLDFMGEYKPGFALRDPDIFSIALKIAHEMNAEYSDKTEKQKTKEKEELYNRTMQSLREAESHLLSSPGDSAVASRVQQLREQSQEHENELVAARMKYRKTIRRNMQDKVMRVTLSKDVSDINDRLASTSGGDVFYVEPPKFSCSNYTCKNIDETLFVFDQKSGDTTCAKCGTVAMEHTMHDGDWTRNFEGEENTSSIGPAPDPFLSTR